MVRAVVVRVTKDTVIWTEGKKPEITIEDFAEPFEETVRMVLDGGWPEYVLPVGVRALYPNIRIVVDADGIPKRLPKNYLASMFTAENLYGTAVFVRIEEKEYEDGVVYDFTNAPDEVYEEYKHFMEGLLFDLQNHNAIIMNGINKYKDRRRI